VNYPRHPWRQRTFPGQTGRLDKIGLLCTSYYLRAPVATLPGIWRLNSKTRRSRTQGASHDAQDFSPAAWFCSLCHGRNGADGAPLTAWAQAGKPRAVRGAQQARSRKFVDILAAKGPRRLGRDRGSDPRFHRPVCFTGAGKKTKTLFYADDRVYWVVMSGQMR